MGATSAVGLLSYDVGSKYGMGHPTPAVADTPLANLTKASPAQAGSYRMWHPDHPLFAFGGLVAITAGLLAFSGSVRVGRATAKASVGKTGD
jgi:hypothetical protein